MPLTFFHNFLVLRKYDLIRLTPFHWQPRILQFYHITKSLSSISTGKPRSTSTSSIIKAFRFGLATH